MSVFFRGSANQVVDGLFKFFHNDLFRDDAQHLAGARAAIAAVREGAWLVNVGAFVFEVVEPPMTVEQDVYGCAKGRACTTVPAQLRPELDAMIKARTADDRGTDGRHFHWVWRVEPPVFPLATVQPFVMDTLGCPTIATVAETVVRAISATSPYETDLHLTLLPDRIRLRVDDEFGLDRTGDPLLVRLSDGGNEPISLAAYLDEKSQRWGVVGDDRACSVWADFPRESGDAKHLASSYCMVPAAEIPSGAFMYREGSNHLAWVMVTGVLVEGGLVQPLALDTLPLPSLKPTEPTQVFMPRHVETRWS